MAAIVFFSEQVPVLWIRDILVRIQIRGSVSLSYGSGFCSFVSGFQDLNKNKFFFQIFFFLLFKVHLQHSSKSLRSHISRNHCFSCIFGLIRIRTSNDGSAADPGGPNTYGSGSTTLLFWSKIPAVLDKGMALQIKFNMALNSTYQEFFLVS
jgi:hypothetical protein